MQTEELSYAIITPYSMRKSRTGGIIARLISRTGLDLVTSRMFAPSADLTKRYADTIVTESDPRHRATQELIRDYVLKNFTSKVNGQRPRVLMLIKPDNFKFPNQRPGGVIEVFSRTGLFIIGFKVHRMSVGQAEEFYGPVLPVLEEKLGAEKGRNAWEDIVEFMAGGRPSKVNGDQRNAP